jgi:flagellar motor switch protein FliM
MMKSDAEDAARHNLQERLLAGAGFSVDRFPMLRAVFDNMAASFLESIPKTSDVSTEFLIESVASGRANDVLGSFGGSVITAAYCASDLDSRVLIGADRRSVFLLVELLFGSDGSEPAYDEERSLTKVETRVGQYALDQLTKALTASFLKTAEVNLVLERIEGKSDLSVGGRKNGFALLYKCKFKAFDRAGEVFIAIPQSALDPFKDALSRDPLVEVQNRDPHWAKQMETRVTQTEVTVHTIMEKRDLTLNDIACLEVGQVIPLPISPTSLVKLECQNQALFWCALGQKDGAYTIRIEDIIDKNEEFIENVLGL